MLKHILHIKYGVLWKVIKNAKEHNANDLPNYNYVLDSAGTEKGVKA